MALSSPIYLILLFQNHDLPEAEHNNFMDKAPVFDCQHGPAQIAWE